MSKAEEFLLDAVRPLVDDLVTMAPRGSTRISIAQFENDAGRARCGDDGDAWRFDDRQSRLVRGVLLGISLTLVVAGAWSSIWSCRTAGSIRVPTTVTCRWRSGPRASLPRAIRNDSQSLNSPIEATSDNLVAGAKLYGANCAMCHGASDAKESDVAKGLYIKAPQLAKDGVEDDPVGMTYFKIAHGYRMTPMPAFSQVAERHADLAAGAVLEEHGQASAARGSRVQEDPFASVPLRETLQLGAGRRSFVKNLPCKLCGGLEVRCAPAHRVSSPATIHRNRSLLRSGGSLSKRRSEHRFGCHGCPGRTRRPEPAIRSCSGLQSSAQTRPCRRRRRACAQRAATRPGTRSAGLG